MKRLIYTAIFALVVLAMATPPAMAQDDPMFKIHGEVRVRGEYSNNAADFSDNIQAGADDQAFYYPYRVRIAAEGNLSKNVDVWIEIQNADFWGNDGPFRSGVGVNNGLGSSLEMYQGNVTLKKLWSDSFSLRIGRQELVRGSELLLGDLDFYSGITHDGAVGVWDLKNVEVSVFYTRPAARSGITGGGGAAIPPDALAPFITNDESDFFGGWSSWNWKNDQVFDVYAMFMHNSAPGAQFWTIGGRYSRDVMDSDGFYYDIEYDMQFGDAAANIDAEGAALEGWLGYNFKRGSNVHRVYFRYEMATGNDTGTADFEGFIPLFDDFHNRAGRGDWFRLSDLTTGLGPLAVTGGLSAYSLGYNGFYNDRHEFGIAYWSYALEEDSGSALGDDLGSAFDLWYGFNYSRNTSFVVSYSDLSPDDALTGGGGAPDDSVSRLYGQMRVRF